MGWADWLSDSDAPDGVSRAVKLEPGDARIVALDAILRSDNGDLSAAADQAVDRDLRRALQLNPLDSTVLMTLGLRAEFRGQQAEAERYLVAAADIDHQFKPAWALANYYVRVDQTEKIWPLVRRCLGLNPLAFDPGPVFDLCWNATSDPDKILDLVPRRRPRLIEYLGYLIRTGRVDAALRVWPAALAVADFSKEGDGSALIPFCGFLVKADRIPEAVHAWNDLVDRSVIHSNRLVPEKGNSMADPLFAYADSEGAFAWHLPNGTGLFVRNLSPSLQFELDGSEPETLPLLQVSAPVLAGKLYQLAWKVDASQLRERNDAGFSFRVRQGDGPPEVQCPLLTGDPACIFAAASGVETIRVELVYARAPGTTRAKGSFRISKTSLEFAP